MRWWLTLTLALIACGSTEQGTTGGGGGGGATTTTAQSMTGGGAVGGRGGAGGTTTCEVPADCGLDDTCATHACTEGTCGVTHAPKGTPCVENGGNVCGEGTCVAWANLSATDAPSARSQHTMVWTGDRAIVWGGRLGPGMETDTGYAYHPATDSWSPVSSSGAPAPRHSHHAVWTGTEMIVWGGFGGGTTRNDGGAYDPATDTWRSLPAVAITGRTDFVMEWNGTELLIWGGRDGTALPNDGARYNPSTDSWGPMAPFPLGGRFNVIAAWVEPVANTTTGALVVWGGSNLLDWHDDGAYWDPVTNTWTPVGSVAGGPPAAGFVPNHALEGSTAVRFHSALYIWGGWDGGTHYNDGFFIDMNFQPGGYWFGIPVSASVPTSRRFHVSVASRKTLGFFIWGGCSDSSCTEVKADGGYWSQINEDPDDPWTYIPEDAALSARSDTAMINTGDEVIIWGGLDAQGQPLADGARRLMPDPDL